MSWSTWASTRPAKMVVVSESVLEKPSRLAAAAMEAAAISDGLTRM